MDTKFRIAELCKAKGLTQQELADKLGISRVGLSKAINGKPNIATLENIAEALGVQVVDLFEKAPDFLAIIEVRGELHKFTSKAELSAFLDTIKNE